MRTLQLVTLALLATAARADTSVTCSNSISGNLADGTPYYATSNTGLYVESAFADCGGGFGDGGFGDGLILLTLVAAGSGPDRGPNLFARASGTLSFTDQIVFYGKQGTTGTVAWNFQTQQSESGEFAIDFPTTVTFGVAYPMSVSISDLTAASTGEDEHIATDILDILGFQLFGPSCDAELTLYGSNYDPASCGPPIDVGIRTASGFLYGGRETIPEPSSLLLLATAVGIVRLVRRS